MSLILKISSFIAFIFGIFFLGKGKGKEQEKNNNLDKFYENVEKARKIENANGGLNSATIYSRMRSREKNNK